MKTISQFKRLAQIGAFFYAQIPPGSSPQLWQVTGQQSNCVFFTPERIRLDYPSTRNAIFQHNKMWLHNNGVFWINLEHVNITGLDGEKLRHISENQLSSPESEG